MGNGRDMLRRAPRRPYARPPWAATPLASHERVKRPSQCTADSQLVRQRCAARSTSFVRSNSLSITPSASTMPTNSRQRAEVGAPSPPGGPDCCYGREAQAPEGSRSVWKAAVAPVGRVAIAFRRKDKRDRDVTGVPVAWNSTATALLLPFRRQSEAADRALAFATLLRSRHALPRARGVRSPRIRERTAR